jgi:lipoate-protein ligase A
MLNQFFYRLSPSFDPHYNLAVEEYIVNHIGQGECMLYFYKNKHTIVIGKHQNPWRECKTDVFEQEGGKIARRISGGGAVYHDLGNLNFSFIMDKEGYDLQRQLSVILHAVNSLGLKAEATGRNDITIDGRKFSGNAFCHKKNGAFHHGTILIGTDMSQLGKYLQVSKEKIQSKGIASVQARVVNLKELNPDITVENVISAVKTAFEEIYGPTQDYPLSPEAEAAIAQITARNRSREWQYGQTPNFDIEIDTRFPWGGISLCLQIKDARVTGASVFTDSLFTGFAEALQQSLVGCAFNSAALSECILQTQVSEEEQPLMDDIASFVSQKGF